MSTIIRRALSLAPVLCLAILGLCLPAQTPAPGIVASLSSSRPRVGESFSLSLVVPGEGDESLAAISASLPEGIEFLGSRSEPIRLDNLEAKTRLEIELRGNVAGSYSLGPLELVPGGAKLARIEFIVLDTEGREAPLVAHWLVSAPLVAGKPVEIRLELPSSFPASEYGKLTIQSPDGCLFERLSIASGSIGFRLTALRAGFIALPAFDLSFSGKRLLCESLSIEVASSRYVSGGGAGSMATPIARAPSLGRASASAYASPVTEARLMADGSYLTLFIALSTLGCIALCLGLFLAFRARKLTGIRRLRHLLLSILCAILFFTCAWASIAAGDEAFADYRVAISDTELLSLPTPGAKVNAELVAGERVRVLDRGGDYLLARTSEGKTGWIRSDEVEASAGK